MDWNIKITKVTNGYVAEWKEEDDSLIGINKQAVFEENESELEAMKNLLQFVAEHFGVIFSKHNKENLVIEIKENTQEN